MRIEECKCFKTLLEAAAVRELEAELGERQCCDGSAPVKDSESCGVAEGLYQSYHADTWSYKGPAPLHPGERPVANHTSYIIHEAVSTCKKSLHHQSTRNNIKASLTHLSLPVTRVLT